MLLILTRHRLMLRENLHMDGNRELAPTPDLDFFKLLVKFTKVLYINCRCKSIRQSDLLSYQNPLTLSDDAADPRR